MKIILIHGDHVTKSRDRLKVLLTAAKKRNFEILRLSKNDSSNPNDILASNSLFQQERIYLIEDHTLLTKQLLSWIKENSANVPGVLIVWHASQLSVSITKNVPPGSKVENYKIPTLIFKFLESLYPGNSKNSLTLLHQLTDSEPYEFIVAMMANYIRDLYWAKKDHKSIPYPSWRVDKLKSQTEKFTETRLVSLIQKLTKADLDAKTSVLPLKTSLDLLLATHLK